MTSESRPVTVHLVAGEESGDALGAALMRALRERVPEIRFGGLGGRVMAEQGITSPFDIHELSIIGFGAGRSEVADALMRGDKATALRLVEQKADVNAPQADGATDRKSVV